MDNEILVVVIAAVFIVAALGIWYVTRQKRSARLRERFGPEYDTTVSRFNDQQRAEEELTKREQRVRKYNIVSLPPAERARYRESWLAIQSRFVDQPKSAVADANRLVQEVMHRCGYPVTDFEQSAADLSVDHPTVVENYRAADRIALNSERGAAGTEDLRQALVHYRALFEDLLEFGGESEQRDPTPWARKGKGKGPTTHPTRH